MRGVKGNQTSMRGHQTSR